MGGPGSGGFKNAPGDTETHAAWDVLEQEDGNTQVCAVLPRLIRTWTDEKGGPRNYHRYDANTVLEKWHSTPLASGHIYSTVTIT